MAEAPFVEGKLYGYFDPAFVSDGPAQMRLEEPADGMIPAEATPTVRIQDGRHLQASAEASPSFSAAAFFEEHGFVLLPHESSVEDWDVDPETPQPDNTLMRAYLPEIEALIRSKLFPGRRLEVWQGPPVRRGPGTPNPAYATGVHQDFGSSVDDYQEGLAAFTGPEIAGFWRQRYESAEVLGFLMIDFWRTTGMEGPLEHMPLAVCDSGSVRIDDVVPLQLLDFTPTGKPTNQTGLRFAADQQWYYYPEMTADEVLAFKNFQCFKSHATPAVNSCFHSAFEHPETPAGAEPRQSSEHRVSVFLLKD